MSGATTASGRSQQPVSPEQKIRRREDSVLITGRGQYVGDIRRPGMLYISFVRSPYPHARIGAIDVQQSQTHPGVVTVVTGADTAHLGELLTNLFPGSAWVPQPAMAREEVNYAGEPIVAVVAESETAALEAAEFVDVDYEVLPSVGGLDAALQENGPKIFNEQSNIAVTREKTVGDVEAGFAQADKIVSLYMRQPRVALVPMEPRGILAEGHADGTLSVWISSQSIFLARLQLSMTLHMVPSDIKITVPHVGGAFGGKTRLSGEEVVTAFLAQKLQRPLRWLESREDNIVSMGHGRGLHTSIQAAVRKDGTVLALKAEFFADLGGYPGDYSILTVDSTAAMISGTYAIPAITTIVNAVKTNAVPTGPYRGAGRPEACYCIERTMDAIAHELSLDPVEVRRRNLIPTEAFPYTTATSTTYDSGHVLVPTLVEGQTHGAITQGIGQALFEEMAYDGSGWVLSANLMNYAVPLAKYLPPFELTLTETPSPLNILGVKGAGEAGAVAAPAAIANAVIDALVPLGVTSLDVPLTSHNVWLAIHKARATASS